MEKAIRFSAPSPGDGSADCGQIVYIFQQIRLLSFDNRATVKICSMPIVYIGIGSNLGNRRYNCLKAIELLRKSGLKVSKVSSLYETEPWGVREQPRFINMAVETETDFPPRKLLDLLKAIEKKMGRKKKEEEERWGPRRIDLDILLYDDLRMHDDNLSIPHPLMHERMFVLEPLSEIAPEIVHPSLHKKVSVLFRERSIVHSSRKSP
jgi:2-amino-4-hydroxy-6-hydroxymethyldihydropteridine diphosphokinase